MGAEAACRGVPAVAFLTGGIGEWLEPGVTGEAANGEWFHVEDFAAALVRALRDESHRDRMAQAAWGRSARFAPAAHAAALETTFGAAVLARSASHA